MNKLILSTIVIGTALGFSTPSTADAVKVQFQPSVTFWQNQTYTRPYPAHRVVREYQDVHYYHSPYNNIYYYYPVQEVVEYYPVNPRPVYSTGTNLALKFKFW